MLRNNQSGISKNTLVFLCGARDFHAMDWYRSALKCSRDINIVIVTDLIEGEGYKRLIDNNDVVHRLLVLDRFLFTGQSRAGDIWRNIVKAILFPFQVILLRRFAIRHKGALYHAHTMYYLWLAWAAGVDYVGIPQGGDILLKPWKSSIYRFLSSAALKAAKAISVDSTIMAENVYKISGVKAIIIQNGIDINTITNSINTNNNIDCQRSNITSFRGLTPLYNILNIIDARNASSKYAAHPLTLIYPFYELNYAINVRSSLLHSDRDIGRVDRSEIYSIFLSTFLAISIPYSDSSPRSVYEAIFCGTAVALAYHPFIDALPECMKSRVIIVNLHDLSWFDDAVDAALRITKKPFSPSEEALDLFDQERSFLKLLKLVPFKPIGTK
jgi:hypothetical protein